ncbi:MAG: RNA polymerase sigma factor [Eubacteriales bacterium]|nr:RNA polymerase sigma factor [Eubacteriales bacterium]
MTEEQFTGAFERQKDRIFRLALSYTKSVPDAEDVCQDVFCKLLAQPPFEDTEQEKAWLIRVTINTCKNLLRSSWWKRRVPLEKAELLPAGETESGAFLAEILELPPKLHVVIHLHYYEGYTAREIGEQLGISESAVQNRLMRARRKLRGYLEEEQYEASI